jgi:hypothetical protein
MGGEHGFLGSLDHPRISGIFLDDIEVDQMSAGSIQHEAEKLLEDLHNGLCLHALSHSTEQPFKMSKKQDIFEIANEKAQSSTGTQIIGCLINFINPAFALLLFPIHNGFLPFGFEVNQRRSGKISFRFSNIP